MKLVRKLYLFLFIIVLASPSLWASEGEPTKLTFGIVPQQSATKLARLWTPILKYLSQETQLKIRFKTAKDIPIFEKRMAQGEYDIAYMNPYHYTVFHQHPGYAAFAKQKNKRIQGILVVRKDSPYQYPHELADQTLVFPSPAAFAASVLIRSYFQTNHLNITPQYVSSHDSVYRNVAKGLSPAGGGIMRTFQNMAPQIKDQLRIVWVTQGYTPHAFATHPRVPPEIQFKLQQAMVAMDQSEEGRALLETIRFQGIETAENSDWEDVRRLDIHLLDTLVAN